ncbi:LOW QUALITY PROTEIN: membrane-anchored junction protein [Loxodonta africana]|uniref:LOW QUALITY PROTEIN: membrane-anchored junction protein n=1 Tax=Loxodonta africana TaxID=9785 RepID=UPI0030D082D5
MFLLYLGCHLGAMSLKPFTYPFPETRFLHAGPNVYKFKIRYGNSIRGEEVENKEVIVRELEDSIRVVLGNLDNLQPFTTEHFIIFPYKSKWERVSHLKFKHGEVVLVPYPFVFTLYVEMKWFHENLSPGKLINDSPLGLLALKVAFGNLKMESSLHFALMSCEQLWKGGVTGNWFLLKVSAEKKSAEAMMRKRRHTEVPSSPRKSGPDRAKVETSSEAPSKKKPPMETRRDRERKTEQEQQETPAFDATDVQEQGPKWGDSLAGQMAPSLQWNNPPPPKGPKELGTTGFFGFLR